MEPNESGTEEILLHVRLRHRQVGQRLGQLLVNLTGHDHRLADLAESVSGTLADPFYANSENDERVQRYINSMREAIG